MNLPWESEFYKFTDADIPAFKRWMKGLVDAGNPLWLTPALAVAATAKGFEEHVHFEINKLMPTGGTPFLPSHHGRVMSVKPPSKPTRF